MTPITAAIKQATANHEHVYNNLYERRYSYSYRVADDALWNQEQHDTRKDAELFRRASIAQQAARIMGASPQRQDVCTFDVLEGATIRDAVKKATR